MSKKKIYINADVLKSELKDLNESERLCYMGVFDIINSQPIIDAKEMRHGKWIIKNNELYWQDKDYSSYELAYVIEWTGQHFEIVEPVEHVESAKPMETERNWEAEYKRLKNEADVMYKELDQAQKELNGKNREIIQLKEEFLDLRRNYDYLDGKIEAYEYAIKCFEKGS